MWIRKVRIWGRWNLRDTEFYLKEGLDCYSARDFMQRNGLLLCKRLICWSWPLFDSLSVWLNWTPCHGILKLDLIFCQSCRLLLKAVWCELYWTARFFQMFSYLCSFLCLECCNCCCFFFCLLMSDFLRIF